MECLEPLQSDVNDVKNASARQCLTNFINVCGALYTIEAENERASQDIVRVCREKILQTHRKSIDILDSLLASGGFNEHSNIQQVMDKILELAKVSESINLQFGQVPPFSQDFEGSFGSNQRLAHVLSKGKPQAAQDAEETTACVKSIVIGLNGLAEIERALKKAEKEVWATNRKLTRRLEDLKQEAGAHPAIEAYTARNCRNPHTVKTRHEEYVQYASAMERVLRKIKKATESLRASSQSDLTGLEIHLPVLRTLSHTLGRLHSSTLEASDSPHLQPGFSETSGLVSEKWPHAHMTLNSKLSLSEVRRERAMAEQLTKAVACVGSMRRLVDASLGQVTRVLDESSADWGALVTAEGAGSLAPSPIGDTEAVLSSLNWPTGADDLLAINTFKFLPLDDKECRDHLVGGTRLLSCAVENLTRTMKARSTVTETQAVLDNALCRPFPETSILRLELIRLLVSQEDQPASEKPQKPKRQKKKTESPTARKTPESKPSLKKLAKNPRNQKLGNISAPQRESDDDIYGQCLKSTKIKI